MKLFTLAINDNGEIKLSSDMSLQEARNILDMMIMQTALEQGRQEERKRIRQGFKKRRRL